MIIAKDFYEHIRNMYNLQVTKKPEKIAKKAKGYV